MNGTKFVVIKLKELVKTVVFAILGVIIMIGLIYFFLPKEEKTALYTPGTYYSQFTLNGEVAELEIVVDKNSIKSVSLTETPETVSVFYPLVETTAAEIGSEIVKQQSTVIDMPSQNTYTAELILTAVEKGLSEASIK